LRRGSKYCRRFSSLIASGDLPRYLTNYTTAPSALLG
jgi:hypothetical protein